MVRPFAVIGFTAFFTIAVLFNYETGVTIFAFAAYTAALVVSVFIKNIRKRRTFPCAFAAGALACALLLCANAFVYQPAMAYNGRTCAVSAVLTDNPELRYGNYYYEARALTVDGEKTDLKLRLSFSTPLEAEPYDVIEGNFSLYAIGASREETLSANKADGMFLGAFSPDGAYTLTNIPESEKPFANKIIDLRSAIKKAIYRVFSDETGALAAALILGDRSGLSAETLGDFGKVGIIHIICVSGLHLSLWSMLIIALFRKTGINKRLTSFVAAVFVVGFMFLTGLTYSVVRAGIMMLVFLLGDVMLKRTDSLNSLGFALTAIAAVNPFALGAVGLQLSALSSLGVILFNQYIWRDISDFIGRIRYKFINNAVSKIVSLFMISVSAMAFTLPITMKIYGGFNFLSPAVNVAAVPAASLAMILFVCSVLFGSVFPSFFNPFAALSRLVSGFIFDLSSHAAKIDFLSARTESDKSFLVICGIFAVCAVALIMTYYGKNVKRVTCLLCALVFTFSMLFFSAEERAETRLKVVDCGNGTAVIACCEGENILIGCGGTGILSLGNICTAVDSAGGRLDAIIVPDNSASSSAFLNGVLSEFRPDKIYCGELPDGSSLLLKRSEIYSFDGMSYSEKFFVKNYSVDNNYCVLLKNQDICALICFDPVFDISSLPDEFRHVDVIISRNDYPRGIEKTGCSLAVINAENKRGVTIQNELKSIGVNCTSTGGCGSITVRADGGFVSAYRE